MRAIVLFLGLLALAACDPVFGVYVRQTLAPAPTRQCIVATLDSSRHVAEWGPREAPGSAALRVFFRDSLFRSPRPMAFLVLQMPSDSGLVLSLEYETIHGPTSEQRARIIDFGQRFLPEVRRACAPDSPARITCEYTGWGGRKTCDSAAEQGTPAG